MGIFDSNDIFWCEKKWHETPYQCSANSLPSDANRWSRGPYFLSHPHTNNGFFFLLTTNYLILYLKNMKKDFQKILNSVRCDMVTSFYISITSQINMWQVCGLSAAVRFLSFPRGSTGMWDRINNGSSDLVCEITLFIQSEAMCGPINDYPFYPLTRQ